MNQSEYKQIDSESVELGIVFLTWPSMTWTYPHL